MNDLSFSIDKLLRQAFQEDIGFGDLSASIFTNQQSTANMVAKESGIFCGAEIIRMGYQMISPEIQTNIHMNDGDQMETGSKIAKLSGPVGGILTGERVILNIIQHLSGIATQTRMAVDTLQDQHIRVCDTRKTLPGMRALQKYAVRCGGGFNHRFRLDDGVMIKDNHIVAAGSVKKAVEEARKQVGLMVKIEVETETEDEVKDAVAAGADIIMIDNKSPEEVRRLRTFIPKTVFVEVSGGITIETIGSYRGCNVDYISMGSLTHSVKALDISLNIEGGKK